MYKVFVSDKRIYLGGDPEEIHTEDEVLSILPGLSQPVGIQALRLANNHKVVHVQGDSNRLLDRMKAEYKWVEAAGGLVIDQDDRVLVIFRRGMWDLPKGKSEPGEEMQETALREVEEECGIKPERITKRLTPTYHTYTMKGVKWLKKSHWYEMEGDSSQPLVPEMEEDIEKVVWMNREELQQIKEGMYPSIIDVLTEGGYL